MSGHSRWANIHRTKDVQDKKRSGIFTKLSKNIMVAAKGGKDPEFNFKLRLAIENARQFNMPKNNIEKAIAKGAGESTEGNALQEVVYEGYGPGKAAVLVEANTDNKNRTSSNIRTIFNKYGGGFGAVNSVMWMFKKLGVIKLRLDSVDNKDDLLLELIEKGAADIKEEEEELCRLAIFCPVEALQKIREFLEQRNIICDYAQIEYVPANYISLTDEEKEKLENFLDLLSDDEDVSDVYVNVKF